MTDKMDLTQHYHTIPKPDVIATPVDKTEAFVLLVREEMLSHIEYENDGRVDAAWMDAIRKIFREYECPDCKFSVTKGHQS